MYTWMNIPVQVVLVLVLDTRMVLGCAEVAKGRGSLSKKWGVKEKGAWGEDVRLMCMRKKMRHSHS